MLNLNFFFYNTLIHEKQALGNKDPYPWLAPQDLKRFHTDREILE